MANLDLLLAKLKAKRVAIGTHITCNDPQQTEMIGNTGFDYFWIDTEHTVIEKYTLLLHLIAARAAGVPSFVRVPWNDLVLAKPILETGIDGIIFPMIETAADAEYAVKSCLYPPEGNRGFGPRRAVRYGLDSVDDYITTDSRKLLKLIQIETKAAVDNIEHIARVPGVDILVLGPMDLSGAYGKLGKTEDPEIRKIYRYVVEKTHEAGKPILVSQGGFSRESIKAWADMGMDLITIGTEPGYILYGAKTALSNAQQAVDKMGKA